MIKLMKAFASAAPHSQCLDALPLAIVPGLHTGSDAFYISDSSRSNTNTWYLAGSARVAERKEHPLQKLPNKNRGEKNGSPL